MILNKLIIGDGLSHKKEVKEKGFLKVAREELNGGADYLNIHIDIPLIREIQEKLRIKLCLEGMDVKTFKKALLAHDDSFGMPILNSAQKENIDEFIKLREVKPFKLILLTPSLDAASILELIDRLEAGGFKRSDLFVDPGICALSTDLKGDANHSLDMIKQLSNERINTILGITNISFGMPKEIKNQVENAFFQIAISYGLSAAFLKASNKYEKLSENNQFITGIKKVLTETGPNRLRTLLKEVYSLS